MYRKGDRGPSTVGLEHKPVGVGKCPKVRSGHLQVETPHDSSTLSHSGTAVPRKGHKIISVP